MIDQDILLKYLKNELTEEETKQLIIWIKEKKENESYLFSLKDSYVYLNYENNCKEADTEHEWQIFKRKLGITQQTNVPPKNKKISLKHFLLNTAAIIIAIVISWQASKHYTNTQIPSGLITLETKNGQQAKTQLPDGSTILLNACSKLTYSLKEWQKTRSIQLDGEAIFDIKKQSNKPFYVHTRHYKICVLGTNFNVSSYKEETEDVVTLKNGKVKIKIKDTDKNTELSPGESFIFNHISTTYKIEKRPLTEIYAWKHNEIIFEGHTLVEKKKELSRHFGYQFQIDSALQHLSFKATLRNESLNEFLSLLCNISPQLTYSIDTNHKIVKLIKKQE